MALLQLLCQLYSTSFPLKYLEVYLNKRQPNHPEAEAAQNQDGVKGQFEVQSVRDFILSELRRIYKVLVRKVHVPPMGGAGITIPSSCLEIQAF